MGIDSHTRHMLPQGLLLFMADRRATEPVQHTCRGHHGDAADELYLLGKSCQGQQQPHRWRVWAIDAAKNRQVAHHEISLLTEGELLQQQWEQLILLLSQMLLQCYVHSFNFATELMYEPVTFGNVRIDCRLDQMLQTVQQ